MSDGRGDYCPRHPCEEGNPVVVYIGDTARKAVRIEQEVRSEEEYDKFVSVGITRMVVSDRGPDIRGRADTDRSQGGFLLSVFG
jgi:hypothetical protein